MSDCLLRRAAAILAVLICLAFTSGITTEKASIGHTPYNKSKLIKKFNLDWSSHQRLAQGSDNWPVTWAADDQQFTAWGDGGGFGGSDRRGRVSLGIAGITGTASNFKGHNVWGGYRSRYALHVDGKSYGILALEDMLYLWVSPGSNAEGYEEARLYYTKDIGRNWEKCPWSFSKKDGIIFPTFLQYGKNFQYAIDDYVYIYAANCKQMDSLSIQKPGQIALLRVPKRELLNRNAYRFFAGTDNSGLPRWTKRIDERSPVFYDKNGVGWTCSASFIKKFNRFFLATEHSESFKGNFGIYEAPHPWGPWSTIHYARGFGSYAPEDAAFCLSFANKFTYEAKNNVVYLIFSGVGENDSFNLIEASFDF